MNALAWLKGIFRADRRPCAASARSSHVVVPRHVAIIMDGNGRWATRHGLPVAVGHEAGARAVKRAVKSAVRLGVKELTVYSFSTENWNRPREEVDGLMKLFAATLDREIEELNANDVRLVFIGRRAGLDQGLLDRMVSAERRTAENTGLQLYVALNYGGRIEIVDAVKSLVNMGCGVEDVTEEAIASRLYAPDMRDPDLVIRTSGEQRLSNFLLWQTAYSEFYFSEILWPDFGEAEFEAAIADYAARERRFGARQDRDA
ncbi:MAG: di-trans,poly-cis-decaprenylcistransferase [Actinobacteria bacterium]|nr:di-trans,poly-cis-decaprenylcistransferase [Actinomycetota bacterium]